MLANSVLLAASALMAVTLADSNNNSNNNKACSSHSNATSQSDLDKIAGCSTFDANLDIGGDAGVLTLNGVKNITGNLNIIDSSELTSFSAPDLATIDGTLDLEQLTILDTLSMPKLANLGGIKSVTLPALQELQFNNGVQNAKDILVSDTASKSLEGLNLSSVETFEVNNNKNIDDISVDATTISKSLDVSFNAAKVNVSFPNLKWVTNATFRYCSSVDMPNLEKVNNSLGFINNTSYSIKLDKLQTVGSLTLDSNSESRNASFSNLTTINGGFVIANNSKLHGIFGFPQLEKVTGAVDFEGNLTTASSPKLDEVDGGVYIDSSGVFNCSVFDEAHKNGDFHGDKYVCKGASTTVSTTLSSGSKTATGSSGNNAANSGSASATSDSGSSAASTKSKSKSKNDGVALSVGGSSFVGLIAAAVFELL